MSAAAEKESEKGEKMAVTLKTVVLESEKCIGCITCMRRCPTEAIRIENGKAKMETLSKSRRLVKLPFCSR